MHLLHKCNYVCICIVSSAGKSVIDSFSPPLVGEYGTTLGNTLTPYMVVSCYCRLPVRAEL